MKKRRLIFLLPIAAMTLGACGKKEDQNEEPGQQESGDSVTLSIKNKANFELEVGATKTLEAVLNGASGTVSWSSDDDAIAMVSNSGVVTAIAPGQATIMVSYGELYDFVVVTVKAQGQEDEDEVISPTQAIALMDETGDGNVVQQIQRVKGICASNSKFDTEHKEYTTGFEGVENFKVQFKDPNNILNGASPDGMEIVVEGYLEKYQGKYQLSYLPADASPTGEKFTPSLVSAKAVEHDAALESITISNAHREFYQNAAFVGETVTAHYSDGSTGVVNATFTGYNMATLGEQTVTVSYTEKGVTKTVTYKITVSEKAVVNYGTEESPLSVTQALVIMNDELKNDKDLTAQAITVEGVVSEVINSWKYEGEDGRCYELNISDGTNSIYIYRCHSNEEQSPNVKVGATVKIVGFAKNFKGTLEFVDNGETKCHFLYVSGGTPTPDKTLTSIEIVGSMTKTTYEEGEAYSSAGLSVKGHYDDQSEGTVAGTITFSKATAELGDVEITVNASFGAFNAQPVTVAVTVTEKLPDPVVGATFTKISSADDLVDGHYLIESNNYVFNGVDNTTGAVAAQIENNVITGAEGMALVEIKAMTGGYSIKVLNGTNAGKYMSGTSGSNALNFGDTEVANTITFKDGVPSIVSNGSTLQYNDSGSNHRFRYYGNGGQKAVALYVKGSLEPEFTSLELTNAPSKTEYYAGEEFNAAGMVITAKYSHGGEDKVLQAGEYTIDKTTLALEDEYVTVSYTEGEITKTVQITVTVTKAPVPVTGITLNKTELSMKVNEADETLEATVAPDDADDPTVTWSVSEEGIVTVTNGVVHAICAGTVTVTATAGDFHADCVVTVAAADKVLSGIEVTTPPSKTSYVEGEKFDPAGMVVTASYSSGHDPEAVTGYTYSTADLTISDTTIEIDYNGQKTTVSITVSPAPVLDSITVANAAEKTNVYTEGDVISKDDLVVTAHYTQGKQDAVVTDYTISKTTALAVEDTSVTITYVEGGVEKTTAYNFTVNPLPHVNSIKAALEGFNSGATTTQYEFEGVVVGFQGNSFFLQDGDYAIMVYNKSISGNAVGKQVKVKSTLKSYNGLIETDSINSASIVTDGDIAMPEAKSVASFEDLGNVNQSALINVVNLEVISKENAWATNKTSNWKVKLAGTETTLSLNQYTFSQANKDHVSGLDVGDTFTVTNAVVGYYNAKQIATTNQSVISKVVSPVTSIALGGDMAKKEYGPGSTWNYSGITCTATLENGGTKSLSFNELTIVSLSADAPAEGVTSLTINVKVTAYPDVTGSITISNIVYDAGHVDVEPYEATFGINSKGNSSYTQSGTYSLNDVDWVFEGNQTNGPRLAGGAAGTTANRSIYNTTAFTNAVSSVEFTVSPDAKEAATINSITLTVYGTADDAKNGTNVKATVSGSISDGKVKFNVPSGLGITNYFVKVTFNITSISKNKGVIVSAVKVAF